MTDAPTLWHERVQHDIDLTKDIRPKAIAKHLEQIRAGQEDTRWPRFGQPGKGAGLSNQSVELGRRKISLEFFEEQAAEATYAQLTALQGQFEAIEEITLHRGVRFSVILFVRENNDPADTA